MKRFMIVILALTLVVLLALGALHYFGRTPESIDGAWATKLEEETVVWTFSEGNITFTYNGEVSENTGSYRYADGVLEFTFDEVWADYETYNCTVFGNKMTLTQDGVEDKLVFTRVEE